MRPMWSPLFTFGATISKLCQKNLRVLRVTPCPLLSPFYNYLKNLISMFSQKTMYPM